MVCLIFFEHQYFKRYEYFYGKNQCVTKKYLQKLNYLQSTVGNLTGVRMNYFVILNIESC